MTSQMIADLPTPDKIFSHEFTLVGLETGQNLRMGEIYVVFMLQKCVSYIMFYIILWKCLTHSWQIQWILWIGRKELIEDPKDCFYVTFLKLKRKIFTIFCVSFTLDSLKILPKVGSSIISKPNLSPPSLPHLLNLPNLPNLLNLLTQNATKAPSSGVRTSSQWERDQSH